LLVTSFIIYYVITFCWCYWTLYT